MTPQERKAAQDELNALRQQQLMENYQQNQEFSSPEHELHYLQTADRMQRNDQLREEIDEKDRTRFENLSPIEKMGHGSAAAFIKTGMGLTQLFTDLTPEQQRTLDSLEDVKGGWATAGEVGTDIVSLLGTGAGGLVTKGAAKAGAKAGAKLAPVIATIRNNPKLAEKLSVAGANVLLGTIFEGVKAPSETTSRTDRMAMAAIFGGLGEAAFPLLKIAGKSGAQFLKPYLNATPTEAAEKFLASEAGKNVKLTPAQFSDSTFKNMGEDFLAMSPFTADKVADLKDVGLEQWNKNLLNQANPLQTPITSSGNKGFQELQDAFKTQYNDVWNVTPDALNTDVLSRGFSDLLNNIGERLPADQVGVVTAILRNSMGDINKFLSGKASPEILNSVDKALRSNPNMERMSQQYLKDAREVLRSSLPADKLKTLKETDNAYKSYKVLEKGASYKDPLEFGSVMTPSNLLGSIKANNSEKALAAGNVPFLDEAITGAAVLGANRPRKNVLRKTLALMGTGASGSASPVSTLSTGAASRGLVNEGMRDLLTTQSSEELMAELLRKASPLTEEQLNRLLTGASAVTGVQYNE